MFFKIWNMNICVGLKNPVSVALYWAHTHTHKHSHTTCQHLHYCGQTTQLYSKTCFSWNWNVTYLQWQIIFWFSTNSAVLHFPSFSCFKPECSCINMKPLQVVSESDKMRCVSSADTRLFFSCQTPLTHPTHSQPSTQCFENVSAVVPNYADNIRTPHVCVFDSIWDELFFRLY